MSDIETLQMALIGYEAERQKIEATMAGIRSQLGLHSKGASAPAKTTSEAKPKHRMSAAGRARIAEAQRKRWAATKKATEPAPATSKPKRRLSAAGKAAIVAALKKRWAAKRAAAKKAANAQQPPAAKKAAKKAPVKASRKAATKGAAKRPQKAAATPAVPAATE
jgi:hypothetical protein